MLIGRKYEFDLFSKILDSERAELGIVYGRRRVGKSYFLRSFGQGKKTSLYFEAVRGLSLHEQIGHFCKQLAEQTQTVQVAAKTWQEAMDALTQYIVKGHHYVVFDELPWMSSERQELVSILKYYWDNKWKQNHRLKMILCGSIAHFMVKHVIHSVALHNRKTFELKMDPLTAEEAQAFFAGRRSHHEMIKTLMVFGGIPKYLEQIDPKQSLGVNLDRLCFQKAGFFVNEFETVFKEQFKITKNYTKIIQALSVGRMTKEQVAEKLKISSGGGLSSYLENLEKAEFIKKVTSIDLLSGKKAKTHAYILWDEWTQFYLTFMLPHLDFIQKSTKPGLYSKLTSSRIDIYFGLCFEKFCIKNIDKILNALSISEEEVISFGSYFRQPSRSLKKKGVQLDLVIFRKDSVLTLVECKFREDPVGLEVKHEMEEKIQRLELPKKISIEKVLITASPLTEPLRKARYFNQVLELDVFF